MILEWDDVKYATGFEEIDAQHKALFKGINELLQICSTGAGSGSQEAAESALKMIDFLGKYVIEHFQCEEDCMERHRCPMLAANKAAHQKFLQQFIEIREKIGREGLTRGLIIKLEGFLCGWLTQHIQKVDSSLRKVQPPEQAAPAISPQTKEQESFFARL